MTSSNVLCMQFNSQKSTAGLTTCFAKLRQTLETLDPGQIDRPMGARQRARRRRHRWLQRQNAPSVILAGSSSQLADSAIYVPPHVRRRLVSQPILGGDLNIMPSRNGMNNPRLSRPGQQRITDFFVPSLPTPPSPSSTGETPSTTGSSSSSPSTSPCTSRSEERV